MKHITREVTTLVVFLLLALIAIGAMAVKYSDSADAYGEGAVITHVSDYGYDKPIIIRCESPFAKVYLEEGRSSVRYCDDVYAVYVRLGEQVQCYRTGLGRWVVQWTDHGWNIVGTNWNNLPCRLALDPGTPA